MVADAFVTQRAAAELAGCSKDTIIRARRAGRFPHARLQGQAWMVPVGDLVAVGLYDPTDERKTSLEVRDNGESAGANVELARALARVAAAEDIVARQDEELRFLRQLMSESIGKVGSR